MNSAKRKAADAVALFRAAVVLGALAGSAALVVRTAIRFWMH